MNKERIEFDEHLVRSGQYDVYDDAGNKAKLLQDDGDIYYAPFRFEINNDGGRWYVASGKELVGSSRLHLVKKDTDGVIDGVNEGVNVGATEKQIGGSHYKDLPIQPSEFIVQNKLDWYQGNVIKYVVRHDQKNGKQDLEKAIHYLQLMIEHYYSE